MGARGDGTPAVPTRGRSPCRVLALSWVVGVLIASCGGGAERAAVERTLEVPRSEEARHEILRRTGAHLYRALREADPGRLLLDDMALRQLLSGEAATRGSILRAPRGRRLIDRPQAFSILQTAAYQGICIQGSRVEPPHSPVGLLRPAWMFDRALVAGRRPSGRRVAVWVEGEFVYTDEGFRAISIGRVEEPRWEHSDLDLAPCDMEVGIRGAPYVVGVTP